MGMDELDAAAAVSASGDDDDSSCSVVEDCSPRIGDEYQVSDIPKLVTRDFLGLGLMDEDEAFFAHGLPVKVTAIHMLNDRKQGSFTEQGQEEADDEDADSKELVKNGRQHQKKGKKKKRGGWSNMRRLKAKNSCEQVIIPGNSFEDLNEDEVAAFILGLYLFGKNFIELTKFVETRDLGEIQYHYYARFFGSAAYKRWFAARNNTSKRIVIGEQILIGWRQDELKRRILKELDEDSRPAMFEAIAAFNKGDISFPAFVYRLRDAIGIDILIDAIGLGCGKRDITMGSADTSVNNKKTEIPLGKAFSEFTASEMSRAISGTSRLSKTRAQDLFWEAIWPRLLAKDWSSEQSSSKGSSLVFLVPGIKRYSKRSLVKGKDYFDSISEVLHHLSTNPGLLELPELDNELLTKTQPETRSRKNKRPENLLKSPSDRKHRQTLWLSKGTHHAHERASEGSSKDAAVSKMEATSSKHDTGDPGRQETPKDEGSFISQLGLASTFVTESCFPVAMVTDSTDDSDSKGSGLPVPDSGKGGYELVKKKRSFFDAFPENNVTVGMASVSLSSGREVWLHNVLRQHLGNGKSMRLYGPMVAKFTSVVCKSSPSQDKLYQLLVKNPEANKVGVIDLFLRLNRVGKLGFSLQVENGKQEQVQQMTIRLEDGNSNGRLVEDVASMDAETGTGNSQKVVEHVEDKQENVEESNVAEDMSIIPACHQSCRFSHKCINRNKERQA